MEDQKGPRYKSGAARTARARKKKTPKTGGRVRCRSINDKKSRNKSTCTLFWSTIARAMLAVDREASCLGPLATVTEEESLMSTATDSD